MKRYLIYIGFAITIGGCKSEKTKIFLASGTADEANYSYSFPEDNSWTKMQDFPGGPRYHGIGFVIGDTGYAGLGCTLEDANEDMWQYDPQNDSWTQIANFLGGKRCNALGINIGNNGYVGLGKNSSTFNSFRDFDNDLWKYDPVLNVWHRKTDFPGTKRTDPAFFNIDGKIYVGTGYDTKYKKDIWQYDPTKDKWQRKHDYPNGNISAAIGINFLNKGYILTGDDGLNRTKQVWQFDPSKDTWIKQNDIPFHRRYYASAFEIQQNIYIGLGVNLSTSKVIYYPDFWQYDFISNNWSEISPLKEKYGSFALSLNNQGFVIGGIDQNILFSDVWRFQKYYKARTEPGDYDEKEVYPLSYNGHWSRFLECSDDNNCYIGLELKSTEDLGNLHYSSRIVNSYRTDYTWFGNSKKEWGVYLNRNYNIQVDHQPHQSITLRFYITTKELNEFVTYFNYHFGTSYRDSDIKIIEYQENNGDLDITHNAEQKKVVSIRPIVKDYEGEPSIKILEFKANYFSKFSISLTSTTPMIN